MEKSVQAAPDPRCNSATDAVSLLNEVLRDLGASLEPADEPGLSPRQRLIEARIRTVRKYLNTSS